jgi:glycosyltransferase involved in cell wall biosynthesis
VLPGIEDFGMVPVEAQACGCPVIALDAGGARETVLDGQTGILVPDASPDSFADAVRRLRHIAFDPAVTRANALRFSRERFTKHFAAAVNEAIAEHD